MKTRKPTRWYWLGLLPVLLVLVAGTSQLLAQPSGSLSNQPNTKAQTTNHLPSPIRAVRPPGPDEEVLTFHAGRFEWKPSRLKEVAPEGEFLWKNGLYRVRGSARLLELVPELDVKKLPEADRSYDPSKVRDPVPNDVVWVMGENARHSTVKTLKAGEKFAFQGRVFETKLSPDGQMMAGYSGQQLNRVTNTFVKKTDTLIDLTVRNADTGVETVITGTPEHPFFVPSQKNYVALGELTPGTTLLSESGANVTVLQSETRHGDFEVFNLEVENQHNYFVSSPNGGEPLLVHNTCHKFNNLKGDSAEVISKGELINHNGVWKTNYGDGSGKYVPADGKYNYATIDGKIYVNTPGSGNGHVNITNGEPVDFAGQVVIKNGEVKTWNNDSGHYQPTSDHANQAKLPMKKYEEVDLDK
jgi:Pretoxin HINT domain